MIGQILGDLQRGFQTPSRMPFKRPEHGLESTIPFQTPKTLPGYRLEPLEWKGRGKRRSAKVEFERTKMELCYPPSLGQGMQLHSNTFRFPGYLTCVTSTQVLERDVSLVKVLRDSRLLAMPKNFRQWPIVVSSIFRYYYYYQYNSTLVLTYTIYNIRGGSHLQSGDILGRKIYNPTLPEVQL